MGGRRAISLSVRRGEVAFWSASPDMLPYLEYRSAFKSTAEVWKTQTFQRKSVIFEGSDYAVHAIEIHLLALSEFQAPLGATITES
jgi:hypothetical protein